MLLTSPVRNEGATGLEPGPGWVRARPAVPGGSWDKAGGPRLPFVGQLLHWPQHLLQEVGEAGQTPQVSSSHLQGDGLGRQS